MNEQRASLEMIAPTVEEAVANGLAELGLPEDAVDVEVLDVGSRGLFGLGSRQARVRLSLKSSQQVEVAPPAPSSAAVLPPQQEEEEQPVGISAEEVSYPAEPEQAQPGEPEPVDAQQAEADEWALRVAKDIVSDLLDKMKVYALVTARFGEPEDARSRAPLLVDISGDDLNILIGPQAETLNALQYIAGLIIGKELGRSVPLVVDVEGYRQRRAQQIRQIARRMADQVVKTGKRQALEPMPANERRLVHIELRNHPKVTTESVGEEPRRKVTILPKE